MKVFACQISAILKNSIGEGIAVLYAAYSINIVKSILTGCFIKKNILLLLNLLRFPLGTYQGNHQKSVQNVDHNLICSSKRKTKTHETQSKHSKNRYQIEIIA